MDWECSIIFWTMKRVRIERQIVILHNKRETHINTKEGRVQVTL
jgi:hypothetical protein